MKFEKLYSLLCEGGAAGHMCHPFDIPTVKTGKDLLEVFYKTIDSLSKKPGSLKIDGVNFSFRVTHKDGKYQFVRDGGTSKELDIKGVGVDDLENRWKINDGKEHGLTTIGKKILGELNANMDLLSYMKKLDVVCDEGVMPCKLINAEYVDGRTNTIDYSGNFLVLHGVLQSDLDGKKRSNTTIEFNEKDLTDLANAMSKVLSIKVLGKQEALLDDVDSVKNEIRSELKKSFTINDTTKTLKEWLNSVDNSGDIRKKPYLDALGGKEVSDTASAVFYHATRVLGKAILKYIDNVVEDDVQKHEGIVVDDKSISSNPFKLTGDFLVDNVTKSKFAKKMNEKVSNEWYFYVGSFKPPHKGHFEAVLQNLDKIKGNGKFVVIISDPKKAIRSNKINADVAKKIFQLYCGKYDLPMDKIEIVTTSELANDKRIKDIAGETSLASPVTALKFFMQTRLKDGDIANIIRGEKDFESAKSMFSFIEEDLPNIETNIVSFDNVYNGKAPMSATELRKAIENNDLKSIKQMIPNKVKITDFLGRIKL